MSDPLRLAVTVVVIATVAFMIVRSSRATTTRPPESVDAASAGLEPGIVLFTSSSCGTCGDARTVVERVLGPDGYVERSWEADPESLTAAGVDEVPLTVIVGTHGVRTVLRGTPSPLRLRYERWLARFGA